MTINRIARIDPSTGLTEVHHRVPESMLCKPLPQPNVVSDVPDETLESVLSEA